MNLKKNHITGVFMAHSYASNTHSCRDDALNQIVGQPQIVGESIRQRNRFQMNKKFTS